MGVYEADGDGGEEGEDCLDSGDVPPVAVEVRDTLRGSTMAHGSIVTDSARSPSNAAPKLLGQNSSSTHVEKSLFRAGANNNAAPTYPTPPVRRGRGSSNRGQQHEIALGDEEDLFAESAKADDTLQCPRCKKEYPTQNHVHFLDHVDKCCD